MIIREHTIQVVQAEQGTVQQTKEEMVASKGVARGGRGGGRPPRNPEVAKVHKGGPL